MPAVLRALVVMVACASLAFCSVASTSAAIRYRSSASSIVSWNTQWAVSRPSGVEEGDLLLACVSTRKRVPASAPAGWTFVREDANPQGVGVASIQRIYVKQAGASEPSSYTFTAPEPVSGATIIAAYTGVDQVSPVASSSGEYRFQPGSAYARAPGLTVEDPGVLLVGCYGHNGRRGALPPTGASERADRWSSVYSTLWLGLELSDEELAGTASPGSPIATGERAALDETLTNYAYTIGQLVALRPKRDEEANPPLASRWFAGSSPFNTPIGDGAVDPSSAVMVETLVRAARAKGFPVASSAWTVPVYYADASTPRYDVMLTSSWNYGRILYDVPVPADAVPDSAGDGHMLVIDTSTSCEYDFWVAQKAGDTWQAGGIGRLELEGSGVTTSGARASSFGLGAGLIRPEEIAAGRIDHALVFSYPYVKQGVAVYPATGGGGPSTDPGAIPYGARIQLDPSLGLDSLGLTSWQETIARALQEYGMYLGDTGGALSLYAQHVSTAATPYPWGQDTFAYLPASLAQHLRVLQLGSPITPQYGITPSRCGSFNW